MIGQGMIGTMHLNPAAFNAAITTYGATCRVYPVLTCDCKTDTGDADPLCPACQGSGRLYLEALAFTCTLDLHGESSQRLDTDPGVWESGSIQANVPTGVDLTTNDKVRVVDGKMTFTELCVKSLDDTLRFEAGIELLAVGTKEHGLYIQGRDYTLTQPNVVTWLGQDAPPEGAQYSVRYRAYPEYLVVGDTPRLRIEGHVVQVAEVTLRLFDKAMRGL